MAQQKKLQYFSDIRHHVDFEISDNLIFVETENLKGKLQDETIIIEQENFAIIKTNAEDYDAKIKLLHKKFTNIEPVLLYNDGTKQISNDELIIKIEDRNLILKLFKGYNYTLKNDLFEKDQYIIKIKNISTASLFSLVSKLSKNKKITYVEPNFIRIAKTQTNDPLYNALWAINNTGNYPGSPGADMDVNDAWNFTTGTGIKVAVLDVGVDLTHPDLQQNLLPGYDAYGGVTSGGYSGISSKHGTPAAGIIGAIGNNGLGSVGIAYGAAILPVRIGVGVEGSENLLTSTTAVVNGINWARANGADVMSNSYSLGSSSSAIDQAISNATTLGRNNKGCVLLFSAGNSNTNSISYPASNSNVIAVGASTPCDERKTPTSCDGEPMWGSNYGIGIDVVAPGVLIYSTDIVGANGYTAGDYVPFYNGTSAACPHAAAVAALILSVNPNLTALQVRQALESSADKIGNYNYASNVSGQPNGTWNNEVGYGRINAHKAVQSVYQYKLSGTNILCTSPAQNYILITPQPPAGTIISWGTSPNLEILNTIPPANSFQILVKSTVSSYQKGTVYATVNGVTIYKEYDIGQRPFTVYSSKTSPGIMTEYCDASYHYLPIDIINSDTAENYFYNLSDFNTGIENPGVTYTQINSKRYLLKIPRNKITPGPYPVITYTLQVSGACGYKTITYNNAITLSPCNGGLYKTIADTKIESEETFNYQIYPNPARNELIISSSANNLQMVNNNAIAVLYDLYGYEKLRIELINSKMMLNVCNLDKGVYLLKIIGDRGEEYHKIILQ